MQHEEYEPPKEMQNIIKCFWYDRKDFIEQQSRFEVVPDGYAEIIFYFGSGCYISYNEGLQLLPSPFLLGLLNQPILFYAKHSLEIIGVRCFPWTVFDLLELPSGKDNLRLFEHPVAKLQPVLSRLVLAGNIKEAISHITQYFQTARVGIVTDRMLLKAGVAMREANGTLPVGGVAAAAHATVRTLERKFRQSSGYTVKDVSGLMRFEQVRNRLWLQPGSSLAGLAQELGYADQAHLSREFKRYSGITPALFARNTKKDRRILDIEFVAFVQD